MHVGENVQFSFIVIKN